ncbi:hypothetical protein [Streptomyces chartreusis]|uniref:hypothetical protein n=1 Tax=Streptomyces chartreusis TaxID=1969 RepID=UPI00342339F1
MRRRRHGTGAGRRTGTGAVAERVRQELTPHGVLVDPSGSLADRSENANDASRRHVAVAE